MLLFEVIATFVFFSFCSIVIEYAFFCEEQGGLRALFTFNRQSRIFLLYILILLLYSVFLKEGCGDVLPGVFTQYFLVLARYKDLKWLSSRGVLISTLFHLYLTETLRLESILYAGISLIISLFLLDCFCDLPWLPFTLLLFIMDPRLLFWGACLSVFFFTLNSLEFFVGKRREGALQALAYFVVLVILLGYLFIYLDSRSTLFPGLLSFFSVGTANELMFLCGFTLVAGACIIFAFVNDEGPAWGTLLLYILVCFFLLYFALFTV